MATTSGHPAPPAGYPGDYERRLDLADGRVVFVRPILPSDAAELADVIRNADADTLHRRFLGGAPRITRSMLAELTEVDYRARFALIAQSDGEWAGIGRYIALGQQRPEEPREAEVAVAVAAGWRGIGLATRLIELLAQRAHECGIGVITATYLADNRPVEALLKPAHGQVSIADGVAEAYITLGPTDAPGSRRAGE